MPFSDIKGQEGVTRFLKSAIESGRLAHAYLFHGFEGSGRFFLARAFVKAMNCEAASGDFCGECSSCARIESGCHPDVLYARQEEKTGAIKVDAIRAVSEALSLKPFEARYKAAIIRDAHLMTEESANAFLKTLEEPPPHSVIILMSPSRYHLRPTVASRCQTVSVPPLGRERLKALLASDYGMADADAAFLSRFAEGRLGRAIQFMDGAGPKRKETLSALDEGEAFEGMSKLGRDEVCERLSFMAGWFRDILVSKITPEERHIINTDRLDAIKERGSRYSTDELQRLVERILETISLIRRDVAVKLALGALFAEIQACTK